MSKRHIPGRERYANILVEFFFMLMLDRGPAEA